MNTKKLTSCALVAAIYVAISLLLAPYSYGPVQVRVSEALTLLPFLAPYTTFGLFAGCILANLLNPLGVNLLDVVFGSLATLIAAYMSSKAKKAWIAAVPPVLINAIVIGAVLAFTLAPDTFWGSYMMFGTYVGIGQLVSCFGLGIPLVYLLKKLKIFK